MTLEEARRTLGLSAEEDVKNRLGEFAAARNQIAELVRSAPNETLALRYQDGLIEFDKALAVLREESEKEPEHVVRAREWMVAARGSPPEEPKAETPPPALTPPPPSPTPPPPPPVATTPAPAPSPAPAVEPLDEDEDFPEEPRRGLAARVAAVFLILLVAVAGGGAIYLKHLADQKLRVNERLAFLERLGAMMIEARRWPEATSAYNEIDQIRPGTKTSEIGRRSIEAGMEEEQRQFVGYWSGEATNAFELGRLEDAISAARKVLEKYPNQKEIAELLQKAEQARSTQAREELVTATSAAIQKRRWDEADFKAKQLADSFPGDPEGNALLAEIRAGRDKEAKDRQRARQLFDAAKQRDTGAFDRNAYEWLREAAALAPEDAEIATLYQKIAAYTRTIQVPADYPKLADAIASARDRDRIVVAEGTFTGPLIIDKAISLEGAGRDKTFVEVEASESTAATFGRHSGGTRVSGITFRHRGFEAGNDRFSAVLVRGAEISLSDCRAADAAGHGLAVVEAGRVTATRCLFENNGWDGVAVRGAGSRIELSECEATSNIGHGFDLWDGGSAAIHQSVARDNSGNGIVVGTTADNVVIGNCDLRANREYGIVVAAAGSGRVHANRCRENLLGGMAVRTAAARLIFENNILEKNLGPGLALEKGLLPTAFSTNTATGNAAGQNVVANGDFSSGD
ncbi:right-handed parallel beta-helix repeat-containing protein [Luteolibacter arcticus]|uniref:Right-handed parallel beta-helix repeat-containing protein n=1 Tax=Luteolibacter arcticus TaxID=1581411 RepID=A0ABT3GP09_9BACT|nr:right-handed parallel beta-helix repeat-containing protein [Luteolibacter arcticus]MCW1925205.1 right-handed parallel beta-helix repeat-containing protein [Luteolibacter arcticus]